jgi:hypothetical protein
MNTIYAKENPRRPTIKALEEGVKTTYQAIASMLSPLSFADTEEVAGVKVAAVEYANKIQDADEKEMESLMDLVTDMISMEYPDEELIKKCMDLDKYGEMGDMMKMYNEYINALPCRERRVFLSESMRIVRDGYDVIYRELGKEMTQANEYESYEYLLLAQAIFWRAICNLNWSLAELKKKKGEFQKAEGMMIVTNLIVLRVEAFRREKIDLSGLYKTMTAINSLDTSRNGEYASFAPLEC